MQLDRRRPGAGRQRAASAGLLAAAAFAVLGCANGLPTKDQVPASEVSLPIDGIWSVDGERQGLRFEQGRAWIANQPHPWNLDLDRVVIQNIHASEADTYQALCAGLYTERGLRTPPIWRSCSLHVADGRMRIEEGPSADYAASTVTLRQATVGSRTREPSTPAP